MFVSMHMKLYLSKRKCWGLEGEMSLNSFVFLHFVVSLIEHFEKRHGRCWEDDGVVVIEGRRRTLSA